jgi:hypothetical protein
MLGCDPSPGQRRARGGKNTQHKGEWVLTVYVRRLHPLSVLAVEPPLLWTSAAKTDIKVQAHIRATAPLAKEK